MFFRILLISMIPAIVSAQGMDEFVMPFGAYAGGNLEDTTIFGPADLDTMHNVLGINRILGGKSMVELVDNFNNHGIKLYLGGISAQNFGEPQRKLSFETYFLLHAEDDKSDYKFETRNGIAVSINDDVYLFGNHEGVMLGGLYFSLRNNVSLFTFPHFQYEPYLRMAIFAGGMDPNSLVGVFTARKISWGTETRFVDSIFVRDLPHGTEFHPVLLQLKNDLKGSNTYNEGYFTAIDKNNPGNHTVEFEFTLSGKCPVLIDYFKLCTSQGKALIEEGAFNTVIADSVGRSRFAGKIAGWYIADEPLPGEYRIFGFIDSLTRSVTGERWNHPMGGSALFSYTMGGQNWKGFNDFTVLGHPSELWIDVYSFHDSGNARWGFTKYTGADSSSEIGLQFMLNINLVNHCDTVRAVIGRYESLNSWLYIPQFFYGTDDNRYPGYWRAPTRTELSCQTFMGMCYQPIGILFFKYVSSLAGHYEHRALVNPDGSHHEWMYDAVKEDINPYIKAIDSVYLSIEWDTAYVVNPNSPIPPGWISASYAESSDSGSNPDIGWFQVGQFKKGEDKYLMVVNRACSQGPYNPAPAPPVNATFMLNARELALGKKINIIDIAASVDYFNFDSVLYRSDTTYAVEMPEGNIPFKTNLGPGEGRLFKLTKAP